MTRPVLHLVARTLLAALLAAGSSLAQEGASSEAAIAIGPASSGRAILEAVYARHEQYPYVYEEQSMVLVDRREHRQTRHLRRYSRIDAQGTMKILLQFRSPRDVQGVALLATHRRDGRHERSVFLPALGPYLIANHGDDGDPQDDHFLGTDFSIENLTGEQLDDYRYRRREDEEVDGARYHVVDVYAAGADPATANPLRRHYVRADRLYITRTDHLGGDGRLRKRQTHHDLVPVAGRAWRANMILMDDRTEEHQTIIKIDRRIFSPDYVPEEVFTADWIFAHAPPPEPQPTDETPRELLERLASPAATEVRPR